MRFVATAALMLVLAPLTGAQEHAPRVVSEHTADVYSLKTLTEFPRWRALTGDARTWEIYKYFADPRTGLYPMGIDVREGREMLQEFALVRDPIKIINVYGYGFCGILGPVMAAVFDTTGMGRSRTLDIPAQAHVAAETFYDEKWHYLDVDRRAVFRRPNGSLASMADARSDASLWTPSGPLFFPSDPIDITRDAYRQTALAHMYDVSPGGHTMDYLLRQGETFTRWWAPQGGRWNHLDIYNQSSFHRQLLEREPRGPKSKHSDWTVQNHGNGRFVYKPNLTDRSSDFESGLHDAVNVQPGASGLTLSKAGEGFAVFEVRSPYIIVPLVGGLDSRDDDREASVVALDATDAALSISLDNGLTWSAVETNPTGTDLTRLVSGTYGYLLKISLEGEPGAAVVRSLTLTTWVQVAPASLPSLRRGKNRMEYPDGRSLRLAKSRAGDLSQRRQPCRFFQSTSPNRRKTLTPHARRPAPRVDSSSRSMRHQTTRSAGFQQAQASRRINKVRRGILATPSPMQPTNPKAS